MHSSVSAHSSISTKNIAERTVSRLAPSLGVLDFTLKSQVERSFLGGASGYAPERFDDPHLSLAYASFLGRAAMAGWETYLALLQEAPEGVDVAHLDRLVVTLQESHKASGTEGQKSDPLGWLQDRMGLSRERWGKGQTARENAHGTEKKKGIRNTALWLLSRMGPGHHSKNMHSKILGTKEVESLLKAVESLTHKAIDQYHVASRLRMKLAPPSGLPSQRYSQIIDVVAQEVVTEGRNVIRDFESEFESADGSIYVTVSH